MSVTKGQKQALRAKVLAERSRFSESDWSAKSNVIINQLFQTEAFRQSGLVHTYVSMNSRREVNTEPLIEYILESDKRLFVPITNMEAGTLSHGELTDISELETNKWGVRESRQSRELDLEALDMIIVPMAAADRKGNRLGYGKGFYDRFLAQAGAVKIGLVFHDFLFEAIPTEEFDEKMDIIITEEEVVYL
jgi:5-formyltetrahydrofolate cyclo-ligase